jgi:hypothetical protein
LQRKRGAALSLISRKLQAIAFSRGNLIITVFADNVGELRDALKNYVNQFHVERRRKKIH